MRQQVRKVESQSGLVLPEASPVVESNETPKSKTSRRSFLGRGVAVAAVPATLIAGSTHADAFTFPTYYTGSTTRNFQEIQVDEYDHVGIISNLITSLGGTPRPLPTFVGIQNLSAGQFLSMAVTFENTGVGAYLGASQYISSAKVLGSAVEIALVEAYHAGFLNTLANFALVPGAQPLPTSLTLGQVLNGIAPFVKSLNDNGEFPPVFQPTPSATNDIAILNFALLLEMLEAEFYFYNVPTLFPG